MSEPRAAKSPRKGPTKVGAKANAPKMASKPKAPPKARTPKADSAPKSAGAGAPSPGRGQRKTREGIVVSNKMEKTVVVSIDRRIQHPLYGKTVTRSRRFKAHDAIGCDEGDRVLIMETRPLSREKRWRVVSILEKVK